MSDYYVGEIRVFAGNYAPAPDWHFCDGTALNITDYEVLYAVIGTTYGGSGSTFKLPDLRGRLAAHRVKAAVAGDPFFLGKSGGTEVATVSADQLPAHTHAFLASTGAATTATPGPTVLLAASSPQPWLQYTPNTGSITASPMSPAAVSPAGAGGSHDNIMPGLVINYIIALNGIFPTPGN